MVVFLLIATPIIHSAWRVAAVLHREGQFDAMYWRQRDGHLWLDPVCGVLYDGDGNVIAGMPRGSHRNLMLEARYRQYQKMRVTIQAPPQGQPRPGQEMEYPVP